jgi:putative DNA primase/helicase
MNFERFAEMHGLIIQSLTLDKWVRVATTTHPNKKNGAYIYDGRTGAVQNWAIHEKPVPWKTNRNIKPDPMWHEKKVKAEATRAEKQAQASKKAAWILSNSKEQPHPYFVKKGFPEGKGYVWNDLLVVPMRIEGRLVGCQLIDKDGNKKFLSGQVTKGASLIIENKGLDIICEGYATALSVRRVMKLLRKRYSIHVAFSAGNISSIAKSMSKCLVIADHDPIGIKTAKATGKKYWVSDMEGEDFNDYEVRVGTEQASLTLSSSLLT